MAIHAPAFPSTLTWLNVESPLTLEALRGRPALIEFFTPGCINCVHALEETALLEKRFAHMGFLCIRLLSPKFEHERNPACAQAFISRHHICGPVALDADRVAWDAYAIKAWPSFVLLDENGNVAFTTSGEGRGEILAQEIESILRRTSRSPAFVPDIRRMLRFHFPTRACAGVVDGEERIFVSDAGNHRVVCLDGQGRYLTSLGSDELHSPQGLALDPGGRLLYVCDAGHHRIVSIALGAGIPEREVSLVAGNGESAFFPVGTSGDALSLPLGSPWALAPWRGGFAVALAGVHQLAFWDPVQGELSHVAGSGAENLVDGSVLHAALAQPSGVASGADGSLYFVDAESSSVRRLTPDGRFVETLVGSGLFSFGHDDGPFENAQFQHCNDIAFSETNAGLWVCDSYNNALRFVSFAKREVFTLALPEPLSEPSGLSLRAGKLHLVDANGHRLLVFPEPVFPFGDTSVVEWKVSEGPFGVLADFVRRPGEPQMA